MGVLVPEGPIRSKLFDATGSSPKYLGSLMAEIFNLVAAPGSLVLTGFANLTQVAYLMQLAKSVGATRIADVGFNIGFSAMAFLESAPDVQVVSFEIETTNAVRIAKNFIDSRYPDRHELVYGDSIESIPKFAVEKANQGAFDLVFLDGGHEYEVITADIRNGRLLARDGAIIVVDDMTPWYPWGFGPTSAWDEAVSEGLILPLEYVCDGIPKEAIGGPADRVWAVGRFAAGSGR